MRPRRSLSLLRTLVVAALAIVTVVLPLWLILVNSAKTLGEANQYSLGLPHHWNLGKNYSTVLDQGQALVGLRNTLIIVVPTVALLLLCGSLAAWVFALARSRALSRRYYVSIVGILLPPAIVTSVLVVQHLGLYGSYLGVILFYCGWFMSLTIFFVTGFVKTIPVELEEAARLEGCTPFGVFRRVIVPLLKPVLISTGMLLVLFLWNDFFFPFFLIKDPSHNTLTLQLFNFISGTQYQIKWNLVFADVVLVSLPLLIAFFAVQRRMVAGLTGGAVNR